MCRKFEKLAAWRNEINVEVVVPRVVNIHGFSAHKDSDHLTELVEKANESKKLKGVFTVMGEPKASLFLVQRLRDELDVNAKAPEYGETVELS